MVAGIAFTFMGATMIAVGDAGIGELSLYGNLLALKGGVVTLGGC